MFKLPKVNVDRRLWFNLSADNVHFTGAFVIIIIIVIIIINLDLAICSQLLALWNCMNTLF